MDTQILYDELYNEPAAHSAYQALRDTGGKVYIVGGAVRDTLLGKAPKDIDLMVTGLEKDQIKAALKTLPGHATFAGKNFGVYHYHEDGGTVEIAMPRTETSTGEGHKDFDVNPSASLSVEEDLGRRDFTANALAFDVDSGTLIDPHNGSQDIKEGKLRLISPQSFEDDPLRIVRAIVAYSKHGLKPDEYTLDQMTQNANKIKHLPAERVQQELDKLFSGSDPAGAVLTAYQTGILQYILPEVDNAMGFDQHNRHHDLPVGEHCLAALQHMAQISNDPDKRLAALLHDIGKPQSYWTDPAGAGHFYKHDDVADSVDHADLGADMANETLKRLRYPNDRRARIVNLVQHHMFPYPADETGVRKLLNRVGGEDTARDLLDIRESDASGKVDGGISERDKEHMDNFRAMLDSVTSQQQGTSVKDLAINGKDLIGLGIKPGPTMGEILNDLLTEVIEEPSLNTRDTLIQKVKELHETF